MKAFFKFLFTSMLGAMLGLLFFFLILLAVAGSLGGSKGPKPVKNNSILVLKLDRPIQERETDNPFAKLGGNNRGTYGLDHLLKAIRKAKTDDKIKGILIHEGYPMASPATLQALHRALKDFKTSGKFITAYAEAMTEGGYYLSSTADKIHLYPTGAMEWNGLGSTPTFFKGTLDKLGIQPVLFRVGGFKSAAEPFTNRQLSTENRLQIQTLLNDIWSSMLVDIVAARKGTDTATLHQLASNLSVISARSALRAKLVDALSYQDQVEAELRKKLELGEEDKMPYVNIDDYTADNEKKGDGKIALVYAVGGIQSGEGDESTIGSETLVKALRQARQDKEVKAVVLRVNSGGGSALASDVIAREVELTRAKKPVIASFGDVSASGGYYISAYCDQIVAEEMTITGSIGVIGLLLNTQRFFDDKLGVTFDRVTTNPYADIGNPNRAMTDKERQSIQSEVDTIYQDFLAVVQKGRKFPSREAVHALAQGRVYSGKRALELKLVDALGGLDVAMAAAAKKAGLGTEYTVVEYPKFKNPIEKILEGFNTSMEQKLAARLLQRTELNALRNTFRFLDSKQKVYAYFPYELDVR